jgi:UDP-galactopyranose mutase
MSNTSTAVAGDNRISELVSEIYKREMAYFRITRKLPEDKRKIAARGISRGLASHLKYKLTECHPTFFSNHVDNFRNYSEGKLQYDQLHIEILRSWKASGIDISFLRQEFD